MTFKKIINFSVYSNVTFYVYGLSYSFVCDHFEIGLGKYSLIFKCGYLSKFLNKIIKVQG